MKIRATLVGLTMLLIPAACPTGGGGGQGPSAPPPPVGWDGTNYQLCDVPGAPPPGRVFGPRKGFVHILVVITADRYRRHPEGGRDICESNITLPFRIRLDASLDGIRAVKLDRGRTLPWSENLQTPHFEHLYVPLTGKLRFWQVTMHATHQSPVDPDSREFPRSYIRCAIFVDGNQATRQTARLAQGLAIASCAASGPAS